MYIVVINRSLREEISGYYSDHSTVSVNVKTDFLFIKKDLSNIDELYNEYFNALEELKHRRDGDLGVTFHLLDSDYSGVKIVDQYNHDTSYCFVTLANINADQLEKAVEQEQQRRFEEESKKRLEEEKIRKEKEELDKKEKAKLNKKKKEEEDRKEYERLKKKFEKK